MNSRSSLLALILLLFACGCSELRSVAPASDEAAEAQQDAAAEEGESNAQ